MNQKIKSAPPFAGDLQIAVDRLPEILVPVDLGAGDVDEARAARRAALGNLQFAQDGLDKIAKQYGGTVPEPAVVTSARAAVVRAESQLKSAVDAQLRAKDRRQEAFLREVMPQLEEAAPTLLEVVRVLNDAVAPLAKLHYHAAIHQLPMPRLLAMVPTLQESTRVMTAIANAATAPAEVKDSNDD